MARLKLIKKIFLRLFFRRHYPTDSVKYCGMDPSCAPPHNRTWDTTKFNGPKNSRYANFTSVHIRALPLKIL